MQIFLLFRRGFFHRQIDTMNCLFWPNTAASSSVGFHPLQCVYVRLYVYGMKYRSVIYVGKPDQALWGRGDDLRKVNIAHCNENTGQLDEAWWVDHGSE